MGRTSAGCESASIFRWISIRTLFSCPEVVWIAYQRWVTGSPEQRSGQPDEQQLEQEVEHPDEDADGQRDDDHADRERTHLRAVRPGDLPHLGHDVVVERDGALRE